MPKRTRRRARRHRPTRKKSHRIRRKPIRRAPLRRKHRRKPSRRAVRRKALRKVQRRKVSRRAVRRKALRKVQRRKVSRRAVRRKALRKVQRRKPFRRAVRRPVRKPVRRPVPRPPKRVPKGFRLVQDVYKEHIDEMRDRIVSDFPNYQIKETVERAYFPAPYMTSDGWIIDKVPSRRKKAAKIIVYYSYCTVYISSKRRKSLDVGYYVGTTDMRTRPVYPETVTRDKLLMILEQLKGGLEMSRSKKASTFFLTIHNVVGFHVVDYV